VCLYQGMVSRRYSSVRCEHATFNQQLREVSQ